MNTEWISVSIDLPVYYKEVLYLCVNENGKKEMMVGHRVKGHWTHCCMFNSTIHLNDLVTVTHWMPLPEPPNEFDNELSDRIDKEIIKNIDKFIDSLDRK